MVDNKKDTKTIQTGLIWIPYISVETIEKIVEGDFSPSKSISSRYSTMMYIQSHIDKVKNIIEKIKYNNHE